MELRPTKATLAQVQRGKNGRMVMIEDDVQGIVNEIHEIDHHLRVRWSDAGEYFVVYWKPDGADEGDGDLVTTAQELDGRLPKLLRELYWKSQQPGYSFADEIEALDKQEEADKDRARLEHNAEMYERLGHAMRKDLGYNQRRVYLPKGIPDATEA